MEKISLYIAGKKVDLDDNSFILFNYTMEDLSNPTIVKNSFTKQITLKGTPTNNEIFGNLYRTDRKTTFGDGHTGVSFNPLRKTPFTIYNEVNEIIESGYVKVDAVNKTAGGYEYKVTLYGGLGSLFYDLTYNESGNKITLADLEFKHHDGSLKKIQSMVVNKDAILAAWNYLENPYGHFYDYPHSAWDIINFAPCYNGLPEDFDADKVIMYGEFAQMSNSSIKVDGETYTSLRGQSARMVTMSNPHTEWEMRNIRPYLQRVVVSIAKIIDAIKVYSKNLGYEIRWELDNNNSLFRDGWITMGLIPKNERYSETAITSVLKNSLTPFDYLVSFAKIYGLIFRYDSKSAIVRIQSRNAFYRASSKVIDLSDRIDGTSIKITPLVSESKWYQLGANVVGEFATEYEKEYGVKCGVQRINTGYDFNSEVKELTKDIPFTETVDVAEKNRLFMGYFENSGSAGIYGHVFPIPLYEKVTMKWYKDGEESDSLDVDMTANYRNTIVPFDPEHPYVDWLPKVQFHEVDNKPADGANCILLFNNLKHVPDFPEYMKTCTYYLSDEHTSIDIFNGGKPCWNLDASEFVRILYLPSFRRMLLSNNEVRFDVNWGVPIEWAVVDVEQDVENPNTLYANRWRAYLTDRYDVDTRILKCKVNLSGMQVGQELMRNFFFYDNAIWVLNKISNHSMITDDLTECEFIKVKDIKNYTQGQKES